MTVPRYKLLATDLDDSLLNDSYMIAAVDQEAISKAVKAGIKVVLATGRMFRSALPYAIQLDLDTPLITYQGAYVKLIRSDTVLYSRPVPYKLGLEVVERVMSRGYHINIYIDDQLLVEKWTEEAFIYQEISGVEAIVVGNLAAYLRLVNRETTKILVVSSEENIDCLQEELKAIFRERLHITKSKPFFLELMHPEATKGKALEAVAAYYGIEREKVIAVGDGYNDLEMIDYAGLGVVVANAREEVKARADYVTSANNNGGVAGVISRFVFNEKG